MAELDKINVDDVDYTLCDTVARGGAQSALSAAQSASIAANNASVNAANAYANAEQAKTRASELSLSVSSMNDRLRLLENGGSIDSDGSTVSRSVGILYRFANVQQLVNRLLVQNDSDPFGIGDVLHVIADPGQQHASECYLTVVSTGDSWLDYHYTSDMQFVSDVSNKPTSFGIGTYTLCRANTTDVLIDSTLDPTTEHVPTAKAVYEFIKTHKGFIVSNINITSYPVSIIAQYGYTYRTTQPLTAANYSLNILLPYSPLGDINNEHEVRILFETGATAPSVYWSFTASPNPMTFLWANDDKLVVEPNKRYEVSLIVDYTDCIVYCSYNVYSLDTEVISE